MRMTVDEPGDDDLSQGIEQDRFFSDPFGKVAGSKIDDFSIADGDVGISDVQDVVHERSFDRRLMKRRDQISDMVDEQMGDHKMPPSLFKIGFDDFTGVKITEMEIFDRHGDRFVDRHRTDERQIVDGAIIAE